MIYQYNQIRFSEIENKFLSQLIKNIVFSSKNVVNVCISHKRRENGTPRVISW